MAERISAKLSLKPMFCQIKINQNVGRFWQNCMYVLTEVSSEGVENCFVTCFKSGLYDMDRKSGISQKSQLQFSLLKQKCGVERAKSTTGLVDVFFCISRMYNRIFF